MRNKAKAAVIAQGFAVTDDGADAFVADLTMVAPYSVAGMPPGYAMAVSQYGASAFDLLNKYFVLPYHDATHGFYFKVDGDIENYYNKKLSAKYQKRS